jgi:hypothetical protein
MTLIRMVLRSSLLLTLNKFSWLNSRLMSFTRWLRLHTGELSNISAAASDCAQKMMLIRKPKKSLPKRKS